MDLSGSTTQSFIIRIWREDDEEPAWRGHITHVPSGEKKYFQDMDDIAHFIKPHLGIASIKTKEQKGIQRWINLLNLAKCFSSGGK